ncbi:MAG: HAMP domain-containing sensor histidine kinase [Pseudomonadota bacterium]
MRGTFGTVLAVSLLPLVLAILGVVLVDGQLQRQLRQADEDRLAAELQGFAALYDQRRIVALRQAIAFRAEAGDPAGSLYFLTAKDGAILAGSGETWPPALVPDAPAAALQIQGQPYLAQAQTLRGGFDLGVAVSRQEAAATQAEMRRVFALFGAVMLGAGLLAAAAVARRARAQTARLNAALAQVGGPGGLSARMPQDAPQGSEQAILADHIDAMLARIAHLFDAHQRLGNAVAHEMRTPLARIRARLDTLDLEDVARAGLDDEIRTTIRLFDSLLSIAQMDVEAGRTAGLVPVDLSAVCAELVDLYAPVAEEAQRHLVADLADDATLLGDAQLLSQLVSNLIENGLKYTRPGDTIRIEVARRGDHVRLRVSDDGPGIDAGLRARLFAPFARGAGQQSAPGHGLGLSLVRAIALRHGGKARAPEVEKGFAIEVEALHFSAHSEKKHGAPGG